MSNPNLPHPSQPTNPRDPKGGGGATLNPTRDHVQGEPEDGDKAADSPAPAPAPAPTHPTPPPQRTEPPKAPNKR